MAGELFLTNAEHGQVLYVNVIECVEKIVSDVTVDLKFTLEQ